MQSRVQAAVSFRDAGLFSVFQLALTALRQLTAPGQQADFKLQEQVRPFFLPIHSSDLHCALRACCAPRFFLPGTWCRITCQGGCRCRVMQLGCLQPDCSLDAQASILAAWVL